MLIAICDDDKFWVQSAKEEIEKYISEAGLSADTLMFFSADELLAYEGKPLDVIFLDIKLQEEGPNGIDVAKILNQKWAYCQIIYATNYLNYAMDAYESRHSYFVVKENFSERLGNIFKHILYNQDQHKKSLFFICVGQEVLKLAPDEIYYFERGDHKTYLFTVWGTYELYDRIDDLCKRLAPENFTRCHNSFLLSVANICKMKGNKFYMADGQEISISRKYQKTAKQAFTRWVLSQVR